MNILLQGAGGPASHGVIKSLRKINFDGKIVSVDSNPLSAGFYLSDSYHIIPKAFESDYVEKLLQIVKDENGFSEEFDIDPFRKESLLKGQDEIGRTLISEDKINSFESSRIDRW